MSNHPPHTPCLSSQEMLDYTQGILSTQEQHRIEKHLLDCEFCTDAMEGIAMMDNPNDLLAIEEELNYEIDSMTSEEKEDNDDKVRVLFPWRIAAAVVLIFVSTITLWIVLPKTNVQELALENSEPYPAPADEGLAPLQEMEVANELSAPLAKGETPEVTKQKFQAEDAVVESVQEEKDMMSDDLFSHQTTASAPPAKEESEKIISPELTPTPNVDQSIHTKSATETIGSEVTVASKKSTTRATSSSVEQQDAGVDAETYKVNTDDLFKKGIKEYKSKKYAAAISNLEKCIDKPEAQFYAGVSYFLLENPHLALRNLEQYIQTNQTPYREAAYWYSGLSYLKLENKTAAKQAFEKVLPFKGEFEKQAAEMLKSL